MTRADARDRSCASGLASCISSSFRPVAGLVQYRAQVTLDVGGRARVRAGDEVLPDGPGQDVEQDLGIGVGGQLPPVAGPLEHLLPGLIALLPETGAVRRGEFGEVVDRRVETAHQEALPR